MSVPEFIFQRVLCTDAGLSSSSWCPTAGQILGVPGPAGQVDRLFWRHWDRTGKRDKVSRQNDRENEREREKMPGHPECKVSFGHYLHQSPSGGLPRDLVGSS